MIIETKLGCSLSTHRLYPFIPEPKCKHRTHEEECIFPEWCGFQVKDSELDPKGKDENV